MNLRLTSNSIDNENQLMPIILQILQDKGGELAKKELERLIASYNDDWNKYVNHYNLSPKTGAKWRPFDFTYNYTLKHLLLSGYVKYSRLTPIVLTEKGIEIDTYLLTGEHIRSISQPIWDQQSKEKKAKKELQGIIEGKKAKDQDIAEVEKEDIADNKWREELTQKLLAMDPYKFELFCRGLLRKMGITIDKEKGIAKSNDGGIDGYGYSISANYRTERVALQCKRFAEGSVGSKTINEFKGAIASYSAEYGIFITTSTFTKRAIETAQAGNTPITIIDGEQLIDLIDKLEYKVRRVHYCIPDDNIWES
jgi:restriction system protein